MDAIDDDDDQCVFPPAMFDANNIGLIFIAKIYLNFS
jgi:hypothetical protein